MEPFFSELANDVSSGVLLLVVMVISLVYSGWRTVYGLVVLAGALGVQLARKRQASATTSSQRSIDGSHR